MSDPLSNLDLPPQAQLLMRAFIDDRYGDGTSDMLEADTTGYYTHSELATRFNLTRQAVSHRIAVTRTCLRRIARLARKAVAEQAQKKQVA
jgi:hypothetical protein